MADPVCVCGIDANYQPHSSSIVGIGELVSSVGPSPPNHNAFCQFVADHSLSVFDTFSVNVCSALSLSKGVPTYKLKSPPVNAP